MIDKAKLRAQIDKGSAAQGILDSSIMQEAFSLIEEEIQQGWQETRADEREQRENAYYLHRALNTLRAKLEGFVNNGAYAQKELERDNE